MYLLFAAMPATRALDRWASKRFTRRRASADVGSDLTRLALASLRRRRLVAATPIRARRASPCPSRCPPPSFLGCGILRRGLKLRSCGHAGCRPAGHAALECGLQRRRAKAGWAIARLADGVGGRGPGVIPGCLG